MALRKLMKTAALAFLALAGITGLCAADSEAGIRDAEKAWADAVLARDYSALDKILGEKLIYAHATGAIESKQDYLKRLRSGAQRYDTIDRESLRIVSYGRFRRYPLDPTDDRCQQRDAVQRSRDDAALLGE